jgi:hypothetical protein
MRSMIKEVFVNPTWEQVIEREPLIAFSFYLSGRINVLLSVADEIIDNLDQAYSRSIIDGGQIGRAETLMWLWILGAYEVVRTMCQAKKCFSERAYNELTSLKKILTTARMPAAKMEKPGKKVPVTSNRSPSGLDVKNRDLFINDPDSTPDISARFILTEFDRVMSSITKDDILGHHEASYRD